MRVVIKFLGPIARDDIQVEINSVDELKNEIKKYVSKEWLDLLAVAINGTIVTSLDGIKDGDEISLLPPVCGG